MTASDTGGHPDLEQLSDLAEGLADPATAARQRAHLDECAQCRDTMATLEQAQAALAGLEPVTMPADVAARVDAALARERAVSRGAATGEDTEPIPIAGGAVRESTVVPARVRRTRRHGAGLAAISAAAAVLLLAGAVVAGALRLGRHATPAAAPLAGSAAHGARLPTGFVPRQSGANYTRSNLARLVPLLVTGRLGLPSVGPSGGTGSLQAGAPAHADTATSALAPLRPVTSLFACADSLAGGPAATPLAADYARFDGHPALILVLPAKNAPSRLAVWAVGPHCGNPDFYYFATLPRPRP